MAGEPPDHERRVPVDSLFDALSDHRRRAVMRCLMRRTDRPVDVETLDVRLCRDAGVDPGEFEASLRHVHLPKLADVGIVAYDDADGTVRYRTNPAVESLLITASAAGDEGSVVEH